MSKQVKCKKLRGKIEGLVEELGRTDFFINHFEATLGRCIRENNNRKFEQIICYGLGSFCDSTDSTSRYQLALLILMHNHLLERGCLNRDTIEIFDPSFQVMDEESLLSFSRPRFVLLKENEYCGRRLSRRPEDNSSVLFYMPHLDKYLYNNLLGVNWNEECLQRLVVLGNSFQEMIDNELPRKARTELRYLYLLVNNFDNDDDRGETKKQRRKLVVDVRSKHAVEERALLELPIRDESFKHADVFNSLSFHLIDKNWLTDNRQQIRQHEQPDWTCCTSMPADDWDD